MAYINIVDSRRERLAHAERRRFDLIIIGGGIHGCAAAREAVLQGLSVLLLEAEDIASGTSSRSSKMLHGGIRYLEQGDVALVFEALRERAVLSKIAAPFVQPQQFLFPVVAGRTKPAWQISAGLSMYDLLARIGRRTSQFPAHRRLSNEAEEAISLRKMGLSFERLYTYGDGQIDDSRICLEMALDAQELGATILNYTRVISVNFYQSDNLWSVKWKSRYPNEEGDFCCLAILDLRGPELIPFDSTNSDGNRTLQEAHRKLILSRGSHLLFDIPWKLPGLVLPTTVRGRYYFVWPFFNSYGKYTLVGTTDVLEQVNSHDPQASEEEASELLNFLHRDLPDSGLNESTLFQSFCGIRSLVRSTSLASDPSMFPRISRRHRWLLGDRYAILVGGKFTTARHTASQGVHHILNMLHRRSGKKGSESTIRELPGARGWSEALQTTLVVEIQSMLHASRDSAVEAVKRRGAGAKRLLVPELLGRTLIEREFEVAIEEEFAVTTEDILRRRLNLTLTPGAGFSVLPALEHTLVNRGRDVREVSAEAELYRRRWKMPRDGSES